MRQIDADALIAKMPTVMDMQDTYLPIHFKEWLIDEAPTIEPKTKVIAQVTFDEEKLREIVKEAVERFKEEYEITDRPQGEWVRDGHHIRCKRCNIFMCDTDREGDKLPTNYCPNCGARMKGADDDSRSDLKRLTEEDRFSRRWACWANNHKGWSKAKKMNRRLAKRRLKRRTDDE